jgi:hypothetical protein
MGLLKSRCIVEVRNEIKVLNINPLTKSNEKFIIEAIVEIFYQVTQNGQFG